MSGIQCFSTMEQENVRWQCWLLWNSSGELKLNLISEKPRQKRKAPSLLLKTKNRGKPWNITHKYHTFGFAQKAPQKIAHSVFTLFCWKRTNITLWFLPDLDFLQKLERGTTFKVWWVKFTLHVACVDKTNFQLPVVWKVKKIFLQLNSVNWTWCKAILWNQPWSSWKKLSCFFRSYSFTQVKK